jgi:hypothetical protein
VKLSGSVPDFCRTCVAADTAVADVGADITIKLSIRSLLVVVIIRRENEEKNVTREKERKGKSVLHFAGIKTILDMKRNPSIPSSSPLAPKPSIFSSDTRLTYYQGREGLTTAHDDARQFHEISRPNKTRSMGNTSRNIPRSTPTLCQLPAPLPARLPNPTRTIQWNMHVITTVHGR